MPVRAAARAVLGTSVSIVAIAVVLTSVDLERSLAILGTAHTQ